MFEFFYQDMLPQIVEIEEETVLQSAMGGAQKTYTSRVNGISASVQPLSGDKIEDWGRLSIEVDNLIISSDPRLLTAQNGDRVTDQDGNYYIIRHLENQGGDGSVFALYVKRII